MGAVFWDYSGIGIIGIYGIRVLLGAILFLECTECHSVHSAPDSRMNRMNGIRFTWNTQNTHSFGKFLAGNLTRPPCSAIFVSGHRSTCANIVVPRSTLPSVFHFQNEHSFGN